METPPRRVQGKYAGGVRTGTARRERLRLLRVAVDPEPAGRGPFDAPIGSLSPKHARAVIDGERSTLPVERAREELWYRDDGGRIRAALTDSNHLELRLEVGPARHDLELVRIPKGRDEHPYFGRWEYGKHACVLSPKGAGVIVGGADTRTLVTMRVRN